MTTNGTLLDDSVIRLIKRENFGLMVSLDGPAETQNYQRPLRNGKDSFEAAAKGIWALMGRRKRVTVRCTLTKSSPPIAHLLSFFEDFGFTRIAFAPATNPSRPTDVDFDEAAFERLEKQEEELLPKLESAIASGKVPIHFPYARFMRRYLSRPSGFELHCGGLPWLHNRGN